MKDVIIVGGGLKGMLTALFLHDAGLKVMILDKNELGRESSWAGGGLVSPLYPWQAAPAVSVLADYSHRHYPELCTRLREETGVDPQWQRSGLLITDMEGQAQAEEWSQSSGHRLECLEGGDLRDCEPQLGGAFQRALFFPELGQVRSPRLSTALRASLHRRPLLVSEHYPVTGLHIDAGQVKGVYLGEDLFQANTVVLASGAWTGGFPQAQNPQLAISPKLAHSIMFRSQPGLLGHMLVHQGHYLIPRQDGRIVCGPVLEDNGLEKRGSEAALAILQQTACQLVPALSGLPVINQWSSLLSMTADDIPFVGEHPEVRGLFINAGHGISGVATGLGTVRLLVDLILGQESFVSPTAYALAKRAG